MKDIDEFIWIYPPQKIRIEIKRNYNTKVTRESVIAVVGKIDTGDAYSNTFVVDMMLPLPHKSLLVIDIININMAQFKKCVNGDLSNVSVYDMEIQPYCTSVVKKPLFSNTTQIIPYCKDIQDSTSSFYFHVESAMQQILNGQEMQEKWVLALNYLSSLLKHPNVGITAEEILHCNLVNGSILINTRENELIDGIHLQYKLKVEPKG